MDNNIVIYTSNNCSHCKVIMMYLDANDIPYTEVNISTNDKYIEDIVSKGFRTVPILVVNGEYNAVTSGNFKEYLKDVL